MKKKSKEITIDEEDNLFCTFSLFIIVLAICLLNIFYEIEKTETIQINGFKDIYVGDNFNDIYCDTSFKGYIVILTVLMMWILLMNGKQCSRR